MWNNVRVISKGRLHFAIELHNIETRMFLLFTSCEYSNDGYPETSCTFETVLSIVYRLHSLLKHFRVLYIGTSCEYSNDGYPQTSCTFEILSSIVYGNNRQHSKSPTSSKKCYMLCLWYMKDVYNLMHSISVKWNFHILESLLLIVYFTYGNMASKISVKY